MIVIVLVILLLPILYLWFKPLNVGDLAETGHPAQSYAEALERVRGLDAPEAGKLGPVGGTLLLTHGKKTEKVVVLLHGCGQNPEDFATETGWRALAQAHGFALLMPGLGGSDTFWNELKPARTLRDLFAVCDRHLSSSEPFDPPAPVISTPAS